MTKRAIGKTGVQASALGFGCMRLPTTDGKGANIEFDRVSAMLHDAIDKGINYFDTAYVYHEGVSEVALGRALAGGWREKVLIATKMPMWQEMTYENWDRILGEQLARLQTDRIDFYLLHALERNRFAKAKEAGILDWLEKQKAKGLIRFPSFSFHDDADTFVKIIDSYPWAMAQVQINLIDVDKQATMRGVEYAAQKGVGVVAMEPLRGGSLAVAPPDNVQAVYDAFATKRTHIDWAFRFLIDRPEIAVILSGMSNEAQLADNLRIFGDAGDARMTAEEHALIEKVRAAYTSRIEVGCTGCRYCMPCPQNVDIPGTFTGYDLALMFGTLEGYAKRYARRVDEKKDAGQCVSCGACERVCPQGIKIIEKLACIHAKMV